MEEVLIETRRGYCPEFGDDDYPVTVILKRLICIGNIVYPPTVTKVGCRNYKYCDYRRENKHCPLLEKFAR